jgi:hypothetical protein
MLIFVAGLLLGVIIIGAGTAYISKLKQQRRQLSDNSHFTRHFASVVSFTALSAGKRMRPL